MARHGGAVIRLEGFSTAEEAMIHRTVAALRAAGYDIAPLQVLIRSDMPAGYRGMSLADGAALGAEAFTSQDMLNHVLEEELRHQSQKASGQAEEFAPGTGRALEEDVDVERKFPLPEE
ncbi:MAG: hypothetical protein ACRELG_23085 [Gemmataceae bacterium]